jgi:hypothetical protein
MNNQSTMDRRKGPDLWMRSVSWFAVIGWLGLFAALMVAGQAKPEIETLIQRWCDMRLRHHWDLALARHIQNLMFTGLTLSAAGLAINTLRNRRRNDGIRSSLVILAFLSALGLALCLVYF